MTHLHRRLRRRATYLLIPLLTLSLLVGTPDLSGAAPAADSSAAALDWLEGELADDGGHLTTSYQSGPEVFSYDDWGLTIDAVLALAAAGRGSGASATTAAAQAESEVTGYVTGLFTIALYVAGKMFFIGVVLALWVLVAQLLLPLVRLVSFLARSGRTRGRRLRGAAVTAGATAMVAGALLLVPVGAATHAEGIVQAPDGSEVRAGTDGTVVDVRVVDGQAVREGDALLGLEDPLLETEVRRLEWRVREIDRLHARASLAERVKGQMLEGERLQAQADLDDARERLARLVVRSPASGTVRISLAQDLPGRFVSQGDLLALVVRPGDAVARVVVPQGDAARVRAESTAVAVRLSSLPGVTLPAELVREFPAASGRLPFRSLGSLGGGRILVDSRDESGLRTLDRMFQFEIALPGSALAYRPGTRVHVRFRHPARPLASQWYRQVRQLFLARFAV